MATNHYDFRTYTLHIEGVSIDSIPLADVGAYIADLAQLLGQDAAPKFSSITRGSIKLNAKVPREHDVDVKTRGFLLRTGDAPEEAIRARQRISERLGRHRARKATLVDSDHKQVVEIPVIKPTGGYPDVPVLQKRGTVQGQVIRIGGKQEIVSVDIQDVDEHIYSCRAKRTVARDLAKEIFGGTVRAYGSGRMRLEGKAWRIEEFQIEHFEVLDDDPLNTVLDAVRGIAGAWKNHEDPLGELDRIRRGD